MRKWSKYSGYKRDRFKIKDMSRYSKVKPSWVFNMTNEQKISEGINKHNLKEEYKNTIKEYLIKK